MAKKQKQTYNCLNLSLEEKRMYHIYIQNRDNYYLSHTVVNFAK